MWIDLLMLELRHLVFNFRYKRKLSISQKLFSITFFLSTYDSGSLKWFMFN